CLHMRAKPPNDQAEPPARHDKNMNEEQTPAPSRLAPAPCSASQCNCPDVFICEHDVPTKDGGREDRRLSCTGGFQTLERALRLLIRNDSEWEKLRPASELRRPIHGLGPPRQGHPETSPRALT